MSNFEQKIKELIALTCLILSIPFSANSAGLKDYNIGDKLPKEDCKQMEMNDVPLTADECDVNSIKIGELEFELTVKGRKKEIESIDAIHWGNLDEGDPYGCKGHDKSKEQHGHISASFWGQFLESKDAILEGAFNFINKDDFTALTPEKDKYTGEGFLSENNILYSLTWQKCYINISVSTKDWLDWMGRITKSTRNTSSPLH